MCQEHGLSVPKKDTARLRYTQMEKAIADPNTKSTVQYSWKDEIREAIDQSQATNMDEFKDHLNQHDIEIERVIPKSITYRHLAENKKVRGRSRQAAESARLADEKARRDREEREREKQASRTIINDDRDHGLEL